MSVTEERIDQLEALFGLMIQNDADRDATMLRRAPTTEEMKA